MRANVGAEMIAHGAEHAGLQISIDHVVGKTDHVQFRIVGAMPIVANDKHMLSTVAQHVAQPRGFVVKHQVRDRPGHSPIKARAGA
jgi:hypothetical protein